MCEILYLFEQSINKQVIGGQSGSIQSAEVGGIECYRLAEEK